jgi:hypothetical protein
MRLRASLPEADSSCGCWIGLSHLLGVYFRHFATFNKTYGTLGAAIALMIWLYWTGFAILVGAELNAQLAKIKPPRKAAGETGTPGNYNDRSCSLNRRWPPRWYNPAGTLEEPRTPYFSAVSTTTVDSGASNFQYPSPAQKRDTPSLISARHFYRLSRNVPTYALIGSTLPTLFPVIQRGPLSATVGTKCPGSL